MRKPVKALSTRFGQAVHKPGKFLDGHGLILRVDALWSTSWLQRIVVQGQSGELGLGSVDVVSLAEARAAAYQNRKLAGVDGDPLQDRRA